MYARCLSCHKPFEENESLEHLRMGRSVAFDPNKGRLWIVCRACRRWSLAPIEARWEALEEIERLARDRGRLLGSTDHVGLIEVEDLQVVRVGEAVLREEAWWRYGGELRRRRRGHHVNQALETAAAVGLAFATGGAAFLFSDGGMLSGLQRRYRYGRFAWRGIAECETCGRTLQEIRFRKAKELRIEPDDDGEPTILLPCPHCRWQRSARPPSGFRFTGIEGSHVLRRVLSYRNHTGGGKKDLGKATDLIEAAGSSTALVAQLARRHGSLERVGSVKKDTHRSLALEIAVNDAAERRILQLELDVLEARWRQEEEIAAIIDGELTPLPNPPSVSNDTSVPVH